MSAVVLLYLPAVVRIAEQRIGRIDRMNSPHDQVEIFFPDDHPEFALKTDRKFFLKAIETFDIGLQGSAIEGLKERETLAQDRQHRDPSEKAWQAGKYQRKQRTNWN